MVWSREEKAIYHKQYYKDHYEKISAYEKQRQKDNPRDRTEYDAQRYKDNRDRLLAHDKQYHKDHPEVNLRSQKKRLTKLGKTFDMDYEVFRYALMSHAKTVKKRDNNKCTWCNSTNKLRAHHIWHKVFCPESALDPDNGITLCHKCHMEQHRLDKLNIED